MYTMISLIPYRQLIFEQLPVLTASLLIAELFYKFHSFTLECAAFLATWDALDAEIELLQGNQRASALTVITSLSSLRFTGLSIALAAARGSNYVHL